MPLSQEFDIRTRIYNAANTSSVKFKDARSDSIDSIDSQTSQSSSNGGWNALLELLKKDKIGGSEATRVPFNEAYHILYVIREWKTIREVFPRVDQSDLETIADLILQTDLGTYAHFIDEFTPTLHNVLAVFIKLADLGHFLEDTFQMHIFWVFRVHHELRTFEANPDWTIADIAKDTVNFGDTFVRPILEIATTHFLEQSFAETLVRNFKSNMQGWARYLNF